LANFYETFSIDFLTLLTYINDGAPPSNYSKMVKHSAMAAKPSEVSWFLTKKAALASSLCVV